MRSHAVFLVVAMLALPIAVRAQNAEQAPQNCAASDVALPTAFAGWTNKSAVDSATTRMELAQSRLTVAHAATAALHPTRTVDYVTQPEKPGGSVSYGGMLAFRIDQAGTYRIALGSPAWVDVVAGTTLMASSAHGHGPACSTIRKIVDFVLQPGDYVAQISANASPSVAIMILQAR